MQCTEDRAVIYTDKGKASQFPFSTDIYIYYILYYNIYSLVQLVTLLLVLATILATTRQCGEAKRLLLVTLSY